MLLHARATLLRRDFELAEATRSRTSSVTARRRCRTNSPASAVNGSDSRPSFKIRFGARVSPSGRRSGQQAASEPGAARRPLPRLSEARQTRAQQTQPRPRSGQRRPRGGVDRHRVNGPPPTPKVLAPMQAQDSLEQARWRTRAILYAAKSTEDRHGSMPTQLADCRKLAEPEGWEIKPSTQGRRAPSAVTVGRSWRRRWSTRIGSRPACSASNTPIAWLEAMLVRRGICRARLLQPPRRPRPRPDPQRRERQGAERGA